MLPFKLEKELSPSIGLHRILKPQKAAGFDLFSGESGESEDVPHLFLASSASNLSELYARAFSCFARRNDETEEGLFFADGQTLEEFTEEFFKDSTESGTAAEPPNSASFVSSKGLRSKEVQPFLNQIHAVWRLLRDLEKAGFTQSSFSPAEVIRQPSEKNAWKLLPTSKVIPLGSEFSDSPRTFAGVSPAQTAFWQWLGTLPISRCETMRVLLELARRPDFLTRNSHLLENSGIWTQLAPKVPFGKLRSSRKGNLLTLNWEAPSEKLRCGNVSSPALKRNSLEFSASVPSKVPSESPSAVPSPIAPGESITQDVQPSEVQAPAGTFHLFELKSGAVLPAQLSLFPTEALTEFWAREIPVSLSADFCAARSANFPESDSPSVRRPDSVSASAVLELNGSKPVRLCAVRILGQWAHLGRVFRVGGPEDVTFFETYWDEDSLVLDLEWPESIQRVKILASTEAFVSGPDETLAAVRKSSNSAFSNSSKRKTLPCQLEKRIPGKVKVWYHDRFNPLIPKRIPRSEFNGWGKIYLRLFSLADEDGKQVFSLGQSSESRKTVPVSCEPEGEEM